MNIDLSILDGLTKGPHEATKTTTNTNTLIEDNTPINIDFEPLESIQPIKTDDAPKKYHKWDRTRDIQEKSMEMYREYQKNIKISERTRANILKGIKVGDDKGHLLLQAIECISLMTNDKLFYEQAKKDMEKLEDIEGMKSI